MRPSRFLPARVQGFKPAVPAPRSPLSRPLLARNNLTPVAPLPRPASTRNSGLASTSSRQLPSAKAIAARTAFPAWSTSPVNTGNPFYQDDYASATCTLVISDNVLSDSTKAPAEVLTDAPSAMASDDDYAAFLDKASDDRAGSAKTQSKAATSKAAQHTRITTSSVPQPLQKVKATYTSDADEPFEPVSLQRSGATGSLTAKEVKQLIGAKADVTEISVQEFDPHGSYKHVISAVEQAVGGQDCAKVFKVEAGGARIEYWILEVAQESNEVVGMKATSIES